MNKQDVLDWGRQTLLEASQALQFSSERLDDQFIAAYQAIINSSGKVVVAGLGKSGHVGRKIAATLASTGTSSFFVHPSEALHGDLGMLQSQDILLVIAFGGETRETLEVARFAKRRGIPVVALTGKTESSLAKLADIVLDGSVVREACPLNLAPTTSTSVAMALGDALAVALMRGRGFQEQDFAQFHPDGSLGRKLSLVTDHMRVDVPFLRPTEGFDRIIELMTRLNYGILAVLDREEQLVGAITDGDLRRALLSKRDLVFSMKAGDLMTSSPKTIGAGRLALEAVGLMEEHRITSLFVVDARGALKGLLRMHDLLAAKVI